MNDEVRLMNSEFVVFLISAFLIGVILVWWRFRGIGRRLGRMQQEIDELRWMESRLLMMGIHAKPKVERPAAEVEKEEVRQDGNGSKRP
jgi:DNA-binding transcriptional regulator of glucitol operon